MNVGGKYNIRPMQEDGWTMLVVARLEKYGLGALVEG